MTTDADLILIGGGLANGLIAWRLHAVRPELRVVVLESENRLGGNHTWSFHTCDLSPEQHRWIKPLVAHTWSGHEVRFPSFRRRLAGGYHCVTSERFHELISRDMGESVRLGARAETVRPEEVRLDDGRTLRSTAILDGRGPRESRAIEVAYQKFIGQVVRLEEDHTLEGPILMDASVEQRDGLRFVYTLPFARDRLLVEDTRYSDGPELDTGAIRAEIRAYCERRGWRVRETEREEQGILPIILAGSFDALWNEAGELAVSGMRAGLFHHTTGYSLPDAVALADDLVACRTFSSAGLRDRIRARAATRWKRQRYFRMLNRMMFRAAEPDRRYRILEHFYRLPEPVIERFYSGRPSWCDRLRILSGKPPVPVGRALRCVWTP